MTKIPSYVQFANELRRDILAGKYGTEGGLPGIKELGRRSSLSYNTIYRALSLLMGERLIAQRDESYYVSLSSATMTQYERPVLKMQAEGRITFAENIIPVEVVPLPDEIAEKLKLEHGLPVTHCFRLFGETRDGEKKPSWLVKYYYIVPLSDEQRQRMQDNPNLHILLETSPASLQRKDTIFSRLPTKEEAHHLRILETTPVTHQQMIVRDLDENIILFEDLVLVGVALIYNYPYENRPKPAS